MKRRVYVWAVILCGVAAMVGTRSLKGQEESEVKLPSAVIQARTQRDNAIEQAQTRYRNVLQKEMENATRLGKLDVALAIKAELEGEPTGRPQIGGTVWSTYGVRDTVEFTLDGRAYRSEVPRDEVGRWILRKDGTVLVRFPTGVTPNWVLTFDPTGKYLLAVRRTPDGTVGYVSAHARQH